MRTNVDTIVQQYQVGLISHAEAQSELSRLAKQAKFNADYSDDPNEYFRWSRIAEKAQAASI